MIVEAVILRGDMGIRLLCLIKNNLVEYIKEVI